MANQFQTIPEKDFSNGIDQTSSENQIKPTYVEMAENIDTTKPGVLVKRVGYERHAGGMPHRVVQFREETNKVCFTLDSSISLGSLRSVPIVVYGRLSEPGATQFSNTTEAGQYYLTTEADVRTPFPAGVDVTKSVPLSVHLQDSPFLFVGLAKSTAEINYSNEHFLANAVRVNKTTYQIDVDYTAASGFSGIVYAKKKDNVTGLSYQGNASGTPNVSEAVPVGTTPFVLTQAEHQLSNNNIGVKVFKDVSTHWEEVMPDSVTIQNNGTVTIELTNNDPAPVDVRFVLTAVEQENFSSGSIGTGDSLAVVIPTPTSPFVFMYVYLENISTSTLSMIIPDSVSVDTLAGTTTIGLVNNTGAGANFFIFYEYADVQINEICATIAGGASPDVIDYNPQLTIWGLSHVGSYNSLAGDFAGWVQHIDSYKSAGERYLVAGLGGNFFAERQREEVGTAYLLPQLYPRMSNRLGENERIGPAFVDSTTNPYLAVPRTRGHIAFTGAVDYTARASSITYNSSTTYVDYVLEMPGIAVNGTLLDIITPDQDFLTVTSAGYKRNEGEFLIKGASVVGSTLVLSVVNPNVSSSDWNETDGGARCGVFTDRMKFVSESEWLPGDEFISNLFEDGGIFVINCDATYTYMRNITHPLNLPAGLRVIAKRSSRILPLRDVLGVAKVTNFVIGDTIYVNGIARALQVHNVNPLNNVAVTFTPNTPEPGFATVTLGSGTTAPFAQDEEVAFYQSGPYSGEYFIYNIIDGTSFVIESPVTVAGTGKLLGSSLTLDERLTTRDDIFSRIRVTVPSRWIPIEAPRSTQALVNTTHQRHMDSEAYSSQSVVRSTMVQDSMFLTNGTDEVTKFDGVNIYRAGLPRWQPHLFATVDSDVGAETIVVRSDTIALKAAHATGSHFHIQDAGEESTFTVGDRIRTIPAGNIYTVIKILPDTSSIQVDRTITETAVEATSIGFVNRYRYYFRLNAIDANNNVVLSATTGANDMIVLLTKSASVHLRLVGLPAWDIYDYDRLEVEIYRTKANQVGPFYRIATLPLAFNAADGYIDYVDTMSDGELLDFDSAISVLKGAELAPALSVPPRAKYVTSAGNALVLANLIDYPKLDITVTGSSSDTELADLQGKRWLFSKDESDVATTTDNVNRLGVQWVNTTPTAVTSPTGVANTSITYTTAAAHGLSVGDWVYIFRSTAWSTGRKLTGAGWYQVSARTTTVPHTFTVLDERAPAGAITGGPNAFVTASTKTDLPVYLGVDYNYDVENGGNTTITASPRFTAMRRMANAINCAMRMTSTVLHPDFVPWMIANAGAEYNAGQLVIEQPRVVDTRLQVRVPTGPNAFQTFINGTLAPAGAERSARIALFPSRLVASYPAYPETFDAPGTTVPDESDSAVDVNSADGQEITGVIPFFGDSAFGSAQKDSVIVVFKTNSIYLVNFAAKRAGQEAVQKIDSQGLGCTYPYSIANTRQGIVFANEAGIYRLTRNLTVDYVGRMLERYWDEKVDKSQLLLAQGHNYALGRQYKLSFPLVSATANSNVLVYDHTQEYQSQQGLGGWGLFTNHPATGWANLDDNAYFGSTQGRVYAIRKAGDATDYRDDNQPIEAVITFRALDFGDAAIRKYVSKIILHLRTPSGSTGTKFFVSTDLEPTFEELDKFEIEQDPRTRVTSLKFSTRRSKFLYLQNRLSNGTIDEGLEVTGIEYRISGLSDKGLTDAARTKR